MRKTLTAPVVPGLRRASLCAAAVAMFTLLSTADAASPAAFTPRAKGTAVQVPASGKPGTGVTGAFDVDALDRPSLTVTLGDGTVVTAVQTHVSRTARVTTWEGAVRSPRGGGSLTVTSRDSVVSGILLLRGATYELRPDDDGSTLLFEVDPARLPAEAPPRRTAPTRSVPKTAPVVLAATAAAPATHDILILTTAASRSRFGSGLAAMIDNAVADTDAAYRTGGLDLTLTAVDVRNAAFSEGATMEATLNRLEADATALSLRESLGADLVLVVSEDTDYCGIAELLMQPTGNDAAAFGVVASDCLSSLTLAHEVGHMQGLMHDRETAAGDVGALPYGFGYRVCVSGGFRDIMSYACPSGFVTRLREFSNPKHSFNGFPLGIDYETSPDTSADAVRALAVTAAPIAAYRATKVTTAPTAPTALTATSPSASPPRVDLAWTDTSSATAGFAIQRSSDGGLSYTEIARVAASPTTYSDRTVTPGASYRYNVRAFNLAGSSGASNTVAVTVPVADATPDPFTFQRLNAAPLGQVVTSNAIAVSGIDVPAPISVANGLYSLNCVESGFTATPATINNAQLVCVRHTTSTAQSATVTTTLTIGGVSGTFVSDTSPTVAPPAPPPNAGGSGGSGGGGGATDAWALLALAPLALAGGLRRRRRR